MRLQQATDARHQFAERDDVMMSRLRGRGRSTSMCSASFPGRGVITATRSPRNTASVIEWVMRKMVRRVSIQIRCSSVFMASRVNASRAPNGSSISNSAG